MTPPMTPREKVVFKQPCDHCHRTTTIDHRMVITALASGSGDHAELARLAEMADWMAAGDLGAEGSVLLAASAAAEHSADLKALLAENAARRAADERTGELLAESNLRESRATVRATEAERKLAEAEGLLRLWMNNPRPKYGATFLYRDTSTFLSKEAERG